MSQALEALTDKVNLKPSAITDSELSVLTARLSFVKGWIKDAKEYIEQNNLDTDVFSPLWGDTTQPLIAEALFSANKELLEYLRLIWWFSGWPISIYTDKNTFPILDPVFIRYQKLKAVTPERFQYTAPAILGEAGWVETAGGIVNHDVAILQERMQFLYFSGVAKFLDRSKEGMIVELGSGYGGMSLAFHKSFPNYKNVLCDIPQSLAVAFCYLNVAQPNADHYAVTVNGIYHVNSGASVSAEEAFSKSGAYIYLPNYLMPAYEAYLRVDMVFNAMSLHEMPPKTIEYYCRTIPKLLAKQSGVFCEFNTLVGIPNVNIDSRLANSFMHKLNIDYPSLACRLRVWTDAKETFDNISTYNQETVNNYPIDALFEFDCVLESPVVSDEKIKEMLLATLGKSVSHLPHVDLGYPSVAGYSVPVFIIPPGNEPFMGNHLRHIVGRRMQDSCSMANQINSLKAIIEQKNQAIHALRVPYLSRFMVFLRKVMKAFRELRQDEVTQSS